MNIKVECPEDDKLIPVFFNDSHYLIVDKPPNLLTTPGRGPDKQDCLYHRLLRHYPNARVVHRLDMATSGIVIFALSHEAQVAMGHLFERRQIRKTYQAVVSGIVASDEGEINAPLICDWENRPRQKVCLKQGKTSLTRYKVGVRNNAEETTCVLLYPLTGRSHQLRVHMLSLGHPIVGDVFYHPDYIGADSARLLLHAHQIDFVHPITGVDISVTSTVPF